MSNSEIIKKTILSVIYDEIGYTNDEKLETLRYLFNALETEEIQQRWKDERLKESAGATDEK